MMIYTRKPFPEVGQIVTICGSVKLGKEVWDRVAQELAENGALVFTVNVWDKYDYLHSIPGEKMKTMLDGVHKLKISMSDAVLIIYRNNYLGASTKSERQHAWVEDKPVFYLDVDKVPWYVSEVPPIECCS
jgi:hypothetical protein